MLDTIFILDCGQTPSGLIARTLRGQDFYCELVPPGITAADLKGRGPKGVIIAAENGTGRDSLGAIFGNSPNDIASP